MFDRIKIIERGAQDQKKTIATGCATIYAPASILPLMSPMRLLIATGVDTRSDDLVCFLETLLIVDRVGFTSIE